MQDTLMQAFRAAGLERNPVPSGRTDRGVHARMQVLSMRLVEPIAAEEVAAKLGAVLPPTVGVALSRPAARKFHASWGASEKEYRYRLLLEDTPAWADGAWRTSLDEGALGAALERLVGERDFAAFVDSSSPKKLRCVERVAAARCGPVLELRWSGTGFGRFMVRYLTASAVAVARGELSLGALERALAEGGPPLVHRAPANGLVLWDVRYPAELDPFTAAERARAEGVPATPLFVEPAGAPTWTCAVSRRCGPGTSPADR